MKTTGLPSLARANQIIGESKRLLANKPKGLDPAFKTAISPESRELAKKAQQAMDSANKPVLNEDVLSENVLESVKAPKPGVSVPDVDVADASDVLEVADELEEIAQEVEPAKEPEKTKEIEKIQAKKSKIHKPGIFFLGGFKGLGLDFVSGGYKGVKDMAEYVEGARYYDWDQKSEIVEEIARRDSKQPIILVGHSLGADTAVEIANELNSLDYGYRQVDLLVSLDSVGLNNDLIPSNVAKNINYFADKSWFFNDTANWARNQDKTEVENNLVHLEHTDLDDNHDIQAHILAEIDSLV